MTNPVIEPQSEVLTTFTFTTLEGLHQAIDQMAHEFPGISRGEVYMEDRDGRSLGRLKIVRSVHADGSFTYDAVLATADETREIH